MTRVLLLFFIHLIVTGTSVDLQHESAVVEEEGYARRYSIIGGKPTNIERHPYQVSLIANDYVFCHGVIIDKQWILTLASWMSILPPLQNSALPPLQNSALTIRAASNFSGHGGTIYYAKEVYVHSMFSMYSHDYDFALVKINDHFKFNKHCKKIAIGSKPLKNGTEVTVSGWGEVANGNELTLHEAKMEVVNNKRCQDLYVSDVVSFRMMCAAKPNIGPCIGDYGDPAVYNNKLYGLYSWAEGCTELPSVFSNIPIVRKWIKSTVRKHS